MVIMLLSLLLLEIGTLEYILNKGKEGKVLDSVEGGTPGEI